MQKPGDLFLGVIDFFGILIPGAILVFLHQGFLIPLLGFPPPTSSAMSWIPAFVLAYVLGHFLLGFSDPLDRLAARWPSRETAAYLDAVRQKVQLPPGVPKQASHVFYAAFSYVRVRSGAAIIELERQAAEYKLFRSLTLLFLLNVPLALASADRPVARAGFSFGAAALSYYRFQRLLNWTHKLTYDFYLQLQGETKEE